MCAQNVNIKAFNDYIKGKYIGKIDYATFRSGINGIEVRGFYDIIGCSKTMIENYKFNEFRSYKIPHHLIKNGVKIAKSDFYRIPCYGFKIPIGKIIISPTKKIYIESNEEYIVEIVYIDENENIVKKGFGLEKIMEKFEIIDFSQ